MKGIAKVNRLFMAMQHGSNEEGTCPKAVCPHRPCFCPPGTLLPYFMFPVYLLTVGKVQGCQGNFMWSLGRTPGTSDHAHPSRQPSDVNQSREVSYKQHWAAVLD